MKLGPRTRRRGLVAKIQSRKHETVARMRAAPPLPPRASPRPVDLATIAGAPTRLVTGASLEGAAFGGPTFVATDAALGGSFELLFEARERGARPLFAVDFVVHPVQLERAASSGADGVLIVARVVSPGLLVELVEASRALGLEALVEVGSAEELEAALAAGARMIAVAVRDRDHGREELDRALALAGAVARRAVTVALATPPPLAPVVATSFDLVVEDVVADPA
jgi:hypothetical protein